MDHADAERLVDAYLNGRTRETRTAYTQALADFARHQGRPVPAAVACFLSAGQGGANGAALAYRAALLARGLAPATVGQRLAVLRGLVRTARTLGLVPFALDVPPAPRGRGAGALSFADTAGGGNRPALPRGSIPTCAWSGSTHQPGWTTTRHCHIRSNF